MDLLLSVLQIDDIMRDEEIILDLAGMQNELPWHGVIHVLQREVHEVGHCLVH